jgi:hypothetical protein
MNKELIKEAFNVYKYAKSKNIDPKLINIWDNAYKKRMQKLAGIIDDLGGEVAKLKNSPAHNRTYKKLAVQFLNEALCFVSSFVVTDSFVLRNRQLLVAANR